jgi:hexosaminidase
MGAISVALSHAQTHNLMPQPAKLSLGEGKLRIEPTFRVALSGHKDARIQAAAARLISRLSRQTGMPLAPQIEEDPSRAALTIRCERAGEPIPALKEDESYRLEVTPAQARLTAPTALGVLRGMETFLQLVEVDGEAFTAPAVVIEDRPRFPWRGLLIDPARHWIPIEVLERNLDGMAAVKMNVLHLHLSDDQGFRIESKAFPRLQEMGSDGNYYTQEQIRALVRYAAERGIRIVPEFDMPGHTTSWFVGHPELASAPGPHQVERTWGVHDSCMDPTREETYAFLDRFIGEMAALFPDAYFHIGGDEVNGKQWTANARIQAFLRERNMKGNHDLQAHFNQRLQAIVSRHGKKMVGWDEILHPTLPTNIVVHSWRGQKSLAEAARQGYSGILSFGYYLDLIQPAWQHYQVDPMDRDAAKLSADEQARILGGEACMWSEYVSAETVDSRIWPRAAGVAERLWSPQEVKDLASMYRRLGALSRGLEWVGLTHRYSYAQMLERVAGSTAIEPLKVLADVLEPVKGYARGRARRYTQQTPLNALVDATRPESEVGREFAGLADRAQMRTWLALWRDNHARLAPALERSFLLRDAAPLSQDLSALGAAGLEALDFLESGRRPSETWVKERLALVDRARQPRAELLITIVPAIRKLVEAAGQGR